MSPENKISLIVAAALFMQNLDGTVISTALPGMAASFHEDAVHMSTALTAYLFAIALFIPASGWLADRFGSRAVFCASVAVFTAGSALCGLAHSLPELVGARVVQGAGGAMMLPVGRLVLLRTVPRSRLVSAMAWVTVPALVGPVIGPPLGGAIVTYASWPWIFFLNLPVGLVGIALALRVIPALPAPDPGRLDWFGLLLSGAALAGTMSVLELAGRGVVGAPTLLAIAAASLGAGLLYARRARGIAKPLLDFSLMRLPSFSVSVIAGSLFRVGVGAQPFLLPMMLQVGFGRSALSSGSITFVAAIGAMFMKAVASRTLAFFGFRTVLAVNGLLCAASFFAIAAFRPQTPLLLIYAVLLVSGFLRSLQFTAYNAIAYAEIGEARMSAATTLYAALQQISLTIGIPLSAAILSMARNGRPGPAAFTAAFLVIASISLLASPAALLLPRGAGRELAGG